MRVIADKKDDDTVSIVEFSNAMEGKGLEYAILHYTRPDNIRDPQLRALVQTADTTLREIRDYVNTHLNR